MRDIMTAIQTRVLFDENGDENWPVSFLTYKSEKEDVMTYEEAWGELKEKVDLLPLTGDSKLDDKLIKLFINDEDDEYIKGITESILDDAKGRDLANLRIHEIAKDLRYIVNIYKSVTAISNKCPDSEQIKNFKQELINKINASPFPLSEIEKYNALPEGIPSDVVEEFIATDHAHAVAMETNIQNIIDSIDNGDDTEIISKLKEMEDRILPIYRHIIASFIMTDEAAVEKNLDVAALVREIWKRLVKANEGPAAKKDKGESKKDKAVTAPSAPDYAEVERILAGIRTRIAEIEEKIENSQKSKIPFGQPIIHKIDQATVKFNHPMDVKTDAAGNIYVLDKGEEDNTVSISVFNPDGKSLNASIGEEGIITIKTDLGNILGPVTMTVSATGKIYLLNIHNGTISVFNPDGKSPDTSVGENGVITLETGSLSRGIAIDSVGNIFLADRSSNIIVLESDGKGRNTSIGENGVITPIIGNFHNPGNIAIDSAGNIYVTDTIDNHAISVLNPDGTFRFMIGASEEKFRDPNDIAIDSVGNIYVLDRDLCKVVVLNPEGKGLNVSIGDNGIIVVDKVAMGLAVGSNGNISVIYGGTDVSVSVLSFPDAGQTTEDKQRLNELEQELSGLKQQEKELEEILSRAKGTREHLDAQKTAENLAEIKERIAKIEKKRKKLVKKVKGTCKYHAVYGSLFHPSGKQLSLWD